MFRTGILSIILFFSIAFTITVSVSWIICDMKIAHMEDIAVSAERIKQREKVEKILETVNNWRNEIERQAYAISASENIRIFAQDSAKYNLHNDAGRSDDISDEERAVLQEGEYLNNRFVRLSKQGMFDGAALFYPDGNVMLPGTKFSGIKLDGRTMELIREAGKNGKEAFTRLRNENGHLFMMYIVPVLSGDDQGKPIGSLALDINMDKPFKNFLELGQSGSVNAYILAKDSENMAVISMKNSEIQIKPMPENYAPDYTFGMRISPVGNVEAYSIGGNLRNLNWEVFIEEPVTEIMSRIRENRIGIILSGIVISAIVSLFLTFIWILWRSKSSAEHAKDMKTLYETANAQKFLLDSINASLKAGVILVDNMGRIIVSNPAFANMMEREIEDGMSIAEIFHGQSAVSLLEIMSRVKAENVDVVLEIKVKNSKDENRLYRVSLFPYAGDDNSVIDGGCVAIFNDITEFRKNALLAKERQMSVTASLIKAIESVDPLLDGHSGKMAELSDKFINELKMSENDAETLKMAAILSQIGKIFIPREIFAKKDNLTESELKIISQIPDYSDKLLAELHLDLPVRDVVSQMWKISNGALDKEDALQLAQILALINMYVAMTSNRSWREKQSEDDVLKTLREKFSDDLVKILEK